MRTFFSTLFLRNRSSRRNCDGNQHLTKKRENFRLTCNKSTQERDFQTRIELITQVHNNKQRSLFVKNVAFILRRLTYTTVVIDAKARYLSSQSCFKGGKEE